MRASLLRQMAGERFRNGGPDAADRLERAAIEGIKTSEWPKVRRALQLRLSLKLKPDAAKLVQIERILQLVDEAEKMDIGDRRVHPQHRKLRNHAPNQIAPRRAG